MLNSYFETERQFIEISRIIPLDNTSDTYSPRLYDILQSSCGQVENLLRLICDKLELKYDKKKFPSYYRTLNQTGILERQTIAMIVGKLAYKSFELDCSKETPFWWKAYNDTKHSLPEGYKEGNLRNTIFALTGVYALNCIAAYSYHTKKKILDNDEWKEESSISLNTLISIPEASWDERDLRPKSQIFYPLSYYRPLGGHSLIE